MAGTLSKGLTRRQFVGSLGIAASGLVLPALWLPNAQAEAIAAAGFGSGRALRVAMHVHGSWSERTGSWEAQLYQAASNGYDLLYLTDHDVRAMALNYITSLSRIAWDPVLRTGKLARHAATVSGGSFRLLAESANASPASITLPIQAEPLAVNRFRTSVSGLTIKQKVHSARLTHGARYELVIPLSYHPPMAGRPAGQYQLIYRFGAGTGRRWTTDHGLTGVVAMRAPAAGSTQTLVPAPDIAAIWPEMVAIDNASYGLSFRAKSPRSTAVCDVTVGSVTFTRARTSAASVITDQAAMLSAYRSRFPSLGVHASIETSRTLPHMNPFGIGPWIPDYTALSPDRTVYHRQISQQVHAMGGLICYNHPFGMNGGPLLSPTESDAKRRQVFADMQTVGRFSADILEVGYNVRGNVDCRTHLALWDTFSRNCNFLTGNGVSDDHLGQAWANLHNGFATGVWAASVSQADMVTALAGGRAFTAHASRWPGDLDLLVDDSVPMGAVSVSSNTSRSLAIWATNLPDGSAVQIIGGPVDYAGNLDPGTWIYQTLTPSSFSGNTATIVVDTSASRFYRVQVLDSTGQVVGASNPVWLLRSAPPGGIPPPRRVG